MSARSDAINHYAARAKLSRDRLRLLEIGMLKVCEAGLSGGDRTAAAVEAERELVEIYERVATQLGDSP